MIDIKPNYIFVNNGKIVVGLPSLAKFANRLLKVELNYTIVELFRLRFSANTITKLNKHQSNESNTNPS